MMVTCFKVWSRFTVTTSTGTLKLRIIEPPKDRINDIVELVVKYFKKEEPLFKASGMLENEEAMAEYNEYFMKSFTDGSKHTVVCCLDNDDDEIGEIIAASFLTIVYKDGPTMIPLQPKTKEMQKLTEMWLALVDMIDIYGALNVDSFYIGKGAVVHPHYRGYGIGRELLRNRRQICKEHNVSLTAALMTTYGSQKAAERDNWETIFEFNFQEFGKRLGISFEGCPVTAKVMMARSSQFSEEE